MGALEVQEIEIDASRDEIFQVEEDIVSFAVAEGRRGRVFEGEVLEFKQDVVC